MPAALPSLAILLAAGASRRMGCVKALLPVDGVPLLQRHIDAYRAAGLPVRVVLGAHEALVRASAFGATFVHNPDWETTGPAESAALGLQGVETCLLAPVDTPPPWPSTLASLLGGTDDAVPTWEGQPGHPVRLAAPHPPGRLDYRLRHARQVAVQQTDVSWNLNTPEDWQRWLAHRAARAP